MHPQGKHELAAKIRAFACFTAFLLAASPAALAKPAADLGSCDPNLRQRDEFYKYMCNRNDGSIGWLYTGTRIGIGSPIFAIANRDTENALLVLRHTIAYPGFYCYYDDQNGLNSPSTSCIQGVREMALRPSEKVYANCSQLIVSYSATGSSFKFWDLDRSRYMHWLPVGSKPSYFNGEPQRLAGGQDSLISEDFATLCPAKFKELRAKTGS